MAEVATKKLFENERVIVWEMSLDPGERTRLHTHEHDYFFHVLSGSTLDTIAVDGSSMGAVEFATGSTYYLALDGDQLAFGDIRVPAMHDARNVGSSRYREILVELK